MTNWQVIKDIYYIPCNVRRPHTNVHCTLPLNHCHKYHTGMNRSGYHLWFSEIPQQLELPIDQQKRAMCCLDSEQKYWTTYL